MPTDFLVDPDSPKEKIPLAEFNQLIDPDELELIDPDGTLLRFGEPLD